MSFIAKLLLDGEEMNVLQCSFRFTEATDATGMPNSIPKGGFIKLVVESNSSSFLFDWMITKLETKSGYITFYRRDALSTLKKLEFTDAYCVDYYETFNHKGDDPMQIQLKISAGKLTLNESAYSSDGTEANQPTEQAAPVKKQGYTVEKEVEEPTEQDTDVMPEAAIPVMLSAAQEKAKKIFQEAAKAEPKITNDIVGLGKELNGETVGLDFKQKTEKSIAEKLERYGINKPVKDAIRYTIVFEEDLIAQGALDAMAALEQKGYKRMSVSNTFEDGAPYKGINTQFVSPEGVIMELQFHTPESFHVKQNVNHSLYEEQRVLPRKDPRAIELGDQMVKNSEVVRIPKNIEQVK